MSALFIGYVFLSICLVQPPYGEVKPDEIPEYLQGAYKQAGQMKDAINIVLSSLDVKFLTEEMAVSRTSPLEKATVLLLQSDKSITEISEQVGFTYQRYFSTLFKEMKGVTPSQFRAGKKNK